MEPGRDQIISLIRQTHPTVSCGAEDLRQINKTSYNLTSFLIQQVREE